MDRKFTATTVTPRYKRMRAIQIPKIYHKEHKKQAQRTQIFVNVHYFAYICIVILKLFAVGN